MFQYPNDYLKISCLACRRIAIGQHSAISIRLTSAGSTDEALHRRNAYLLRAIWFALIYCMNIDRGALIVVWLKANLNRQYRFVVVDSQIPVDANQNHRLLKVPPFERTDLLHYKELSVL